MNIFIVTVILAVVSLLSSCASQMTQDEHEFCIWSTALAGTAVGSVGGVGGAAAGAAGGAALGAVMCGPVGTETMAAVAVAEKPLDSDSDGVPDSHDRCAGTAAGVEVDTNGCELDSDHDGVVDSLDKCPGTSANVRVDSDGCPFSGETLLVLENINFATDSAELSGDAEIILDRAVQMLKQKSGVSVNIEGHTDSRADEDYNQRLSLRRAAAVRDYLVSRGIDGSRLTAVGRGENYPVASNETKDGRLKNRRVEFVVR